jgi:hypothetical protein
LFVFMPAQSSSGRTLTQRIDLGDEHQTIVIETYWQIGQDIVERRREQGWGAKVTDRPGARTWHWPGWSPPGNSPARYRGPANQSSERVVASRFATTVKQIQCGG